MTQKAEKRETTEAFVRRILEKTFKQRVDKDTVREVAEKVSEAVAPKATKAGRSKEAA